MHYWSSVILANQGDVIVASHKRKIIQRLSQCHVLQSLCYKTVYPFFFQSYLLLRALFCTLLQIHLLHALVIYST